MADIVDKLIDKSKEAFIMAIEIYNKPTIRYRIEGFSFFICNAWELMLKAYIMKKWGYNEVYYKDNPNRTITLENCISKVFTNNKAPLRINLEKIIELRNTSTHFITEEYEMVYIPLFQSCIFNFSEKMMEFHNIDMADIIPQNFLTLTINMKAFDVNEIRAKYPLEISEKLISTNDNISELIAENNQGFAIRIDHYHYITKDKNKATSVVHIDKNAESGATIIKELKDPNDTHKYNAKKCIREINKQLRRLSIDLEFNMYHFNLFTKYYSIKSNPKLCYVYKITSNPTYSYSIQTIEFIVEEIKKDPKGIIDNLKKIEKK